MSDTHATATSTFLTPTEVQFVMEWVKDLRSGQFQQAKFQLSNYIPDPANPSGPGILGYCCLGVACRTAQRLNIPGADTQNMADQLPKSYGWWKTAFPNVSANPGLSVPGIDSGAIHSAGELNDQYGATFTQIADALEAKYLKPTSPIVGA